MYTLKIMHTNRSRLALAIGSDLGLPVSDIGCRVRRNLMRQGFQSWSAPLGDAPKIAQNGRWIELSFKHKASALAVERAVQTCVRSGYAWMIGKGYADAVYGCITRVV
jgi:hypothetical protein